MKLIVNALINFQEGKVLEQSQIFVYELAHRQGRK